MKKRYLLGILIAGLTPGTALSACIAIYDNYFVNRCDVGHAITWQYTFESGASSGYVPPHDRIYISAFNRNGRLHWGACPSPGGAGDVLARFDNGNVNYFKCLD